jgi:hypothetical protein
MNAAARSKRSALLHVLRERVVPGIEECLGMCVCTYVDGVEYIFWM